VRAVLSGRALVLAGLGVVLFATAAHGTPPGTNGRIVFERLRYQDEPLWGELFTANADGTGVQRLTHPPNGTEDANADWAPDGRRIVFERKPLDGAHSLWTIASSLSTAARPPFGSTMTIPNMPFAMWCSVGAVPQWYIHTPA
jgi:dipeptidyl aminopeptidase/acylaminoacyl peptidase